MASRQVLTDDYERWYTEHVNNNRMVLSLKSGIHHEVNWALDRLCRLCDNDKFHLKALPGLIQALFEWPQWYLTEGISFNSEMNALFSTPLEHEKKTRHALLSMLVLRSASQNTPNAQSLAESPRTRPLILDAFQKLDPSDDSQAECLLWTLEFYLAILAVDPSAGTSFPSGLNPIPILSRIASTSTNRALLVTSINVLANLFSDPSNIPHLKADSPVLEATLRYLPVFTLGDTELAEACVMYLFAHLSNQAMAKAFLHHQDMPTALRLLVQLLISDQVEATTQVKIIDPVVPVSSTASGRTRRLMKVEAELIGRISEPGRTIQWLQQMFELVPNGEMSQVEVFNLYRDTFTPYSHEVPLVAGGEVVRQLAHIFPTTMSVKIEEPQRFVIRGLARKKEDRLVCCWDRDQCPTLPFETRTELVEHVRQHVVERVEDELPCLWSTCPHPSHPKARLWTHLITHLQSQLPDPNSVALSNNGVTPPPTIAVTQATNEPPATSLTALLCIRLLFHLSFSATGAAPRSDADRFGFPGLADDDEEELATLPVEAEEEGKRKGRQAFVGVRYLLGRVQIKDLALMGWITEMLETTTYAISTPTIE